MTDAIFDEIPSLLNTTEHTIVFSFVTYVSPVNREYECFILKLTDNLFKALF